MRRSIATVCLSGTLEDKLSAAAAAGFHGVEIFENDLIASPMSPEEVRARCADLGLTIDLYQPFRDFEAVGPELHRLNLRRAERKFDVMRRLGADTVLVCSSVAPEAVDDDDLAAGQLHALADRAADHGLRVAYEALAWGRFVNTWEHSADIVLRAGHPALGLCLDSFHVLSRTEEVSGISRFPGEKVFFLQLADAPRLRMDVLQWSRHHRLFPGQGSFDLTGFVGRVLDAGYRGPLSLEVFNDVFRQSPPDRAAVDAMRSLITLEENLASRSPAAPGTSSGLRPPPAPELHGYAFAEIAADDSCAPAIARALAGMGFTHTGQHRSKPVQLWQQGAARVLLNSHGGPGGRETALAALAVESADPERSAARARHLLAPALDRDRGPAEADLTSVAAPDGTAVFFCRTGAADSWLGDFILTGSPGSSPRALTRIDHVALAQPFDFFDEASLFYRSLLGLEPGRDTEYAAPFGLVRSRLISDARRQVRIVLDGTVLRRGAWAPAVPDPQHIAFATDDIFATARALRERGTPLLKVPDNYYEDLDARLELPPGRIEAMRECQVLHDRDRDGEFFHLCTQILGSRIFFQVVQRTGGYAGCGAVNAPVRMAAQRAARRGHGG